MKLKTHWYTQLAAIGLQVANVLGTFPSPIQPYVAIGLSAVQAALAIIAHHSDTSGNPLPDAPAVQ